MKDIWPKATQAEKDDGWTFSVEFLEAVKEEVDSIDSEYSGSLELIENCLIAAEKIVQRKERQPANSPD